MGVVKWWRVNGKQLIGLHSGAIQQSPRHDTNNGCTCAPRPSAERHQVIMHYSPSWVINRTSEVVR